MRGGGLGGIFGGSGESAFRTRRGFEKTLFRFTIALVVVFVILCILSVRFAPKA
ncbi:MAG: preprotein translocase subunit SecG [Chloroflexi bacterium]|nr:preprotein translocase subunit SecG [Chloroflexota bacterium]